MGKPKKAKLGEPSQRAGQDSTGAMFMARAEKWASANSSTQEAAREKLTEMGIYDSTGKLAKDYR